MGARGPKPAPTTLKILAGTRPDRVNQAEPSPAESMPEPPAELSTAAAKEWARVAPILARMRVLTEADGAALAVYCETFAEWDSTGRKLRKQGMLTATAAGGIKVNPLACVHQRARADLLRALAEFGLSPSSRSRVTVAAEEEADALADFINARKA